MSKAQDTSSLLEQITLAWWSERIDFFIRLKILVILGRRVSSPASRFSCEKSDQKMGKSAF